MASNSSREGVCSFVPFAQSVKVSRTASNFWHLFTKTINATASTSRFHHDRTMPRYGSSYKKKFTDLQKTRDFFNYQSPFPIQPQNGVCSGPSCAQFDDTTLTALTPPAPTTAPPLVPIMARSDGDQSSDDLIEQKSSDDEQESQEEDEGSEEAGQSKERYGDELMAWGQQRIAEYTAQVMRRDTAGLAARKALEKLKDLGIEIAGSPRRRAGIAEAPKLLTEILDSADEVLRQSDLNAGLCDAADEVLKQLDLKLAESHEATKAVFATFIAKVGMKHEPMGNRCTTMTRVEKEKESLMKWAVDKIVKMGTPIGERALRQLKDTLSNSLDSSVTEGFLEGSGMSENSRRGLSTEMQSASSNSDKVRDARKGGERAITKWSLLRGLKSASEEFVSIAIPMPAHDYERFTSLLEAPNTPTGAYSILAAEILADCVGKVMFSTYKERRESCDSSFTKLHSETKNDLVAKRWRALRRDFPTWQTMVKKLNVEREAMLEWINSGSRSGRKISVAPANENSVDAIREAMDGQDELYGDDELAAFAKRLVGIDENARFHVHKGEEVARVESMKIRADDLNEVKARIFSQYPGLNEAITGKVNSPYHPDFEEDERNLQ